MRAMRRLLAEYLGTFTLVFAGTGAIIADHVSGGAVGNVGIALVFGLVVLAMVRAFGGTSGAHLNPAVSWALALAGRFPWRELPAYIAAQLAGAFTASGALKLLFPRDPTLGATFPVIGLGPTFVMEALLTLILVHVILNVPKGNPVLPPVAIGAVVGLEAMFAGPFTGASMNPARSLAPAILGGHFQDPWLYPAATFLGATLAVPLCKCVRGGECCRPSTAHIPS
jgi:aquaporin Z